MLHYECRFRRGAPCSAPYKIHQTSRPRPDHGRDRQRALPSLSPTVAGSCSVLQWVAMCCTFCGELQWGITVEIAEGSAVMNSNCCWQLQCVTVNCSVLRWVAVCCSVLQWVAPWRKRIKQMIMIISLIERGDKRAAKYTSLLRKMTYKDKGSYESSPLCRKRIKEMIMIISLIERGEYREDKIESSSSNVYDSSSSSRASFSTKEPLNIRHFCGDDNDHLLDWERGIKAMMRRRNLTHDQLLVPPLSLSYTHAHTHTHTSTYTHIHTSWEDEIESSSPFLCRISSLL